MNKNIISLKFLDLDQVGQFKKEFNKLSGKKLQFNEYDLVIFPEDFEHCCYEYDQLGAYKAKFSFRRAKRILQIEQICQNKIPYQIIYEHSRHKKTIAVVSHLAELCLILLPVTSKGKKFFRLTTLIAFGKKVESSLEKVLKNGQKIKSSQLNKVFTKENGS